MKVRQLINELLDIPMDAEIDICFTDKDFKYKYQKLNFVVYYNDDHTVGLVGSKNNSSQ